jgi:hypothetical protein
MDSSEKPKLRKMNMIFGKRPVGRSRRRWVDNIKTDLIEIRWG